MTSISARSAEGPGPLSEPIQRDDQERLDIDALRKDVAEVLDVSPETIEDDANLVALGLESVKVMALSARLRRYGVRVKFARMVEEPTLSAWWRLVTEARGEAGA